MRPRAHISRLLRGLLAATVLAAWLGGVASAQWAWEADAGWINLQERPADSERGQYAYAKSLFIQGFFAGAADAFADFERRFPESPLIPRSVLQRAQCLAKLGRNAEAMEAANVLTTRKEADASLRKDAATLMLATVPQIGKERAADAVACLVPLEDESYPVDIRFRAHMEESRRLLQLGEYDRARDEAITAGTILPGSRAEAAIAAAMADLVASRDAGHDEKRVQAAAARLRECENAPPDVAAIAREYLDMAQSILSETIPARRDVYYATTYLYEKDFAPAAAVFKSASKKFKTTPVGETAAYYRGETAFAAGEWADAYDFYEKCAKDYPSTRRMRTLVEREFALAKALDREGDTTLAILVMEAVGHNYPLGALADDAYMFAGQAYMARSEYAEAKACFDVVVYAHPRSEWNTAAVFMAGKCDLKQSELARDNDALLEQTRRAFELYLRVDSSGRFAEEARSLLAECKRRQAAALMSIAAMYERRTEPRSAMVYYERVLKDYPDSPSAAGAQAAMAVLTERGVRLPWNRPAKTDK